MALKKVKGEKYVEEVTCLELISPIPLARNKAHVIRLLFPMVVIQELCLLLMIGEAWDEK